MFIECLLGSSFYEFSPLLNKKNTESSVIFIWEGKVLESWRRSIYISRIKKTTFNLNSLAVLTLLICLIIHDHRNCLNWNICQKVFDLLKTLFTNLLNVIILTALFDNHTICPTAHVGFRCVYINGIIIRYMQILHDFILFYLSKIVSGIWNFSWCVFFISLSI